MQVEISQDDFMPAFGAYVAGSAKQGPALVRLNLEALLGTVAMGDVEPADLPYFVAETIMHEVMHALEDWAGVAFSEDRVEAMIAAYQAKRMGKKV